MLFTSLEIDVEMLGVILIFDILGYRHGDTTEFIDEFSRGALLRVLEDAAGAGLAGLRRLPGT